MLHTQLAIQQRECVGIHGEKVFEIKDKQKKEITLQCIGTVQTNVESAHRTATTKVITQQTRHNIKKATVASQQEQSRKQTCDNNKKRD